jgi:polyisoprenyl-phosphate glycosyltransferase
MSTSADPPFVEPTAPEPTLPEPTVPEATAPEPSPTERIPAEHIPAEHTERIHVGELAGRAVDPVRHRDLPGERTEGASSAYRIEGGDPSAPVPYLTVVLPCYNEGAHVREEIERITTGLDASEFDYEVLCIDDASTDDTIDVLRASLADHPHVRVLPFRRNGGSGTVRRIGTQLARGEIVVWTDADMTYENDRIPELVRLLRDDPSYDQVVGARTSEEGTHKWARVPAKWLIRRIAERLTKTRIPDLNSGLRAFRREVSLPYLRLLPAGFSCVTTLTIAFLSNQHDIKYVPTQYAKRAGTSKFHFLHDAYRYILQVLRMVMYFDPLRVLMPVALWLLVIGSVKAVVDLVRYQTVYFANNTVLLIVSGLIIATLALLADLVVRSRAGV